MKRTAVLLPLVFLFILPALNLYAWHDKTHIAIGKVSDYKKAYNCAAADVTKTKARLIEQLNHYYNNPKGTRIGKKLVLKQIPLYNSTKDRDGHLYGAIIASIREFERSMAAKKYAEYHLAFLCHYAGDLSQPLHNTAYDDFNRKHHIMNDGIIEKEVLENRNEIIKRMYDIEFSANNFEDELAYRIAKIANISLKLGKKMKKENRNMTKDEAYEQIAHSASLLKAILKHLGK